MRMTVERLERLGEALHRAELDSGLAVLVLPKPGFTKRYATFATRYGSIDRRFRTPDGEELEVPDGIAHFLEHQMFAKEYGDAFDRFSALGASANAYTSYTTTTYLFSSASRFEEAFDLLLDFVQEPYFTRAGVEKERGIIEQELRMYEDSPEWRLFQQLRECLFVRHPFRIDIGGTVESIRRIDEALLLRCYRTFYHPSNMVVSVVGDVQPEAVVAQVEASLARHGGYARRGAVERLFEPEPEGVSAPRAEARMAVARPLFALGFKERPGEVRGAALVRREILTAIVLDAAAGKGSPLYARLYEAGLIDAGFAAQYLGEATFGMAAFSGQTDDPDRLLKELQEGLFEFAARGVEEADFERARNRIYGEAVAQFDSPEAVAHELNHAHFLGVPLDAAFEVLETITPEEATARARELLRAEAAAVSIVRPA
ncbi:MAG: insulinase family protein [Firmicutes bacterium]|nr:insulinase family protein [Bacillota bacterium]